MPGLPISSRQKAKLTLACVAVCSASLIPGHAIACSDLPNICAAQAQHHQQMNDISATAEQNESRGYDGGGPGGNQPRDPMADAMANIYGVAEASAASSIELQQRMKDPQFKAAYDRFHNGGWDFFQDSNNPKPGEYCSALYTKGNAMVRISGPGSGYDGALLTFSGPDITGSPDVRKLKVTLNQSDGTSQSVQAFNYQLPGEAYASIAFAMPTIEAGLAEMKEILGFDVHVKGKSVLKIDWNGGLAARKKLETCLSKRRSS